MSGSILSWLEDLERGSGEAVGFDLEAGLVYSPDIRKIYRFFGREKHVHKVLGGGLSTDVFLWRDKKLPVGGLGALQYGQQLTLVLAIDERNAGEGS